MASPKRRAKRRPKKEQPSGALKFSEWDEVYPKLKEEIRRSERLTAKDLAVTINAKG